jgi:NADPH:quinone reductase-like Zn-dependent oxidoreductase
MKVKRVLKWSIRAILVALILAFLVGFIAYWRSTNDCNAPIEGEVMKAIKVCEYGVGALQLADVAKPVPLDDQVLIKVRAASLNALDVFMIRDTWFGRLFFGLRKPRDTRLGRDVGGVVEAVGKSVTQFKPGDEVFGICRGALAEYACAFERALVMKPPHVSFEQAAAVPLAGLTALQGIREGKVQPGQKVLINGATGGVGTFAVQIAKASGAEITAVCSTRNVDLVRSIGADHVIDYTKEDFTKSDQRYDVIFDNVCNHSFFERRRVLTPKGICVLVGMGGAGVKQGQAMGRIAGNLFAAWGLSSFTDQKFAQYMTKLSKPDLILLGELMQAGKVRPVIERTYKLNDAPEAVRQLDAGHARGKLVITVGEESR